METSVLISCNSCQAVPETGLRCRINAKTSVSAFWDAEKQAVCCQVTKKVRTVAAKHSRAASVT